MRSKRGDTQAGHATEIEPATRLASSAAEGRWDMAGVVPGVADGVGVFAEWPEAADTAGSRWAPPPPWWWWPSSSP